MPDEIPEDLISLSDMLVTASIRHGLPGKALSRQPSGLAAHDYIRLVNEAALLAQSSNPEARTLAYEIATHSLSLSKSTHGVLTRAVDFIMARLGNFPGRELLRSRYRTRLDQAAPAPAPLIFEALGHEHENTIQGIDGEPLRLTDFQYDLLDAMETTDTVSVSAPTSAGKSFVLSLHILRRIQNSQNIVIVYVVPTRALIREVILRLRQALANAGIADVALRSVPQSPTQSDASGRVIYVLTQERLLTLLQIAGKDFSVSMLVVDEAQGVRDGGRGVLLQIAIRAVIRSSPKAKVIFASPLINNPQYLLDLFELTGGVAPREFHSPVAQSMIIVSRSQTNRKFAQFSLLRRGHSLPLGERDLGFDFGAMRQVERRARLAVEVAAERDGCLIYANGAWEAEETALALASLRASHVPSREVQELVSYIEENIHPEYALLQVLKAGVAFHHGEMPASVRAGVEDLFRQRKLQFMCCTGTLLQGVNLPARHLVVERPRRGNGQPMGVADFLNLAGRAGRLRREFHGNVWCLRTEFWETQPQDKADLPDVSSALANTMQDGGTTIQRVLEGDDSADADGAATAAINHLLTEYIRPERPPDFVLTNDAQPELRKTFAALRALPLTLPSEVFERNSSILPTRIQSLYLALSSQSSLDDWLPMPPFDKGFYPRLCKIFEFLQTELHGKKTLEFKFEAWLAFRWIHQDTLQKIIDSQLNWRRSQGLQINVREIIRGIIRRIEKQLRFQWVRSLRAYHDVLALILRSKGRDETRIDYFHSIFSWNMEPTTVLFLASFRWVFRGQPP